jgi:hypothetical protein
VAVCTGMIDPARLAVVEGLGPEALMRKPINLVEICLICEMTIQSS